MWLVAFGKLRGCRGVHLASRESLHLGCDGPMSSSPHDPGHDDDVIDVEVVDDAEVEPSQRRRLADDAGGRVFDADGRLERVERVVSPGGARSGGGFQPSMTTETGCTGPVFRWLGRLFGVFAVLALVVIFLWAGGFTLQGVVDWAHDNPFIARGAVVVMVTVLLPLMLPTGPIAVVPGYLWGQWHGLALVLAGACLGGVLNMVLACKFVRRRVDAWVMSTPALAALRRTIDARGFRIALALRLSPVTPYALVSYLAGLTGIRYGSYALASLIGGIPWTLVYATAGSLLAEQSRAVTLDVDVGPAGPWLRLIGLGFTIFVAIWLGRAARSELAKARSQMQ